MNNTMHRAKRHVGVVRRCLFRNARIILPVFVMLILTSAAADYADAQDENLDSAAYHYFRDGLLLSKQGRYDEAVAAFQRAARIDTHAVIFKALGDVYVEKLQRYDLGAAAYEKYLEKNAHDNFIIDRILKIYSLNEKYARAERTLSQVINAGNDLPQYFVALIDFYLKDKKVEEAQNTSIIYYERTGESQESSAQIAQRFIANSMVVEGEEFFSGYMQAHPGVENLGITAGYLHEARQDYAAAEKAYLNVLKKNEYADIARKRLASIYIRDDDYERALKLYEGIDFDDPSEIPVKVQVCSMLLQSDNPPYEQIEQILLSVTDKFGADSNVFYLLGIARASMSHFSDAEESLAAASRLNPADPRIFYALANARYEMKKFNRALESINKAIELAPQIKDFYVLKGILYDRLGDGENAIAAYEAGIAVASPNRNAEPTLLNNYSYLLAQQGSNLDKALEMAKKAVLAEPDNSSFLDTIGWVYYKMGKFEDALKYIQRSVGIDSTSAEVLDHLGDVYYGMGQKDAAVKYWRQALEHDQDTERIKKIREKLQKSIK